MFTNVDPIAVTTAAAFTIAEPPVAIFTSI